MSEERLRWLSITFGAVLVGIMFPNVASNLWVLIVAWQLPPPDQAGFMPRVRMIFPVIGWLSLAVYALVTYAAARTARAALRESAASRLAVTTSVALAVLSLGVLTLRTLFVFSRATGADVDVLVSATEVAHATLVLTIAASVAQEPHARGTGMVAVGMLVLALALGVASSTTVSSVMIVLATLCAWVAIGVGLRRVQPLAAPRPSIASTFE